MIEKSNNINGIEHRSTVVAKAVSNHSNQQLTLYVHDQLMGGSTLANDKVELLGSKNFKPVIVDTVSVDDFCDSTGQVKCDIVKIDVENYEEQVLKGMKKTIQRNANIKILMEYTKGAYSGEFWPLLEDTFSHISAYVEGMGFVDLNTEADLTKLMPGDWYKGWTMLLLRNS